MGSCANKHTVWRKKRLDRVWCTVGVCAGMDAELELPVVDVSALLKQSAAEGGDVGACVYALMQACEKFGMVSLVGHGMPPDVWREVERQGVEFFTASDAAERDSVRRSETNARGYADDELTKNQRDAKLCYDYGGEDNGVDVDGVNLWPSERPRFRASLEDFFERMDAIARAITRGVSLCLGLEASALEYLFSAHTSFCRLNYYAPSGSNPQETFGVHRHTDAGFFTLLMTNGVPGLQLYIGDGDGSNDNDPGWRTVLPRPDSICFNVADMLQVLSNDRVRSAQHRVKNLSSLPRFTTAFFWNPASEVTIDPRVGAGREAPRYRPLTFGEFRRKRFEGDFADHGKEVQVDQFRRESTPPVS